MVKFITRLDYVFMLILELVTAAAIIMNVAQMHLQYFFFLYFPVIAEQSLPVSSKCMSQ